MNAKHWNKTAAAYDDDVMCSLLSDRSQVLKKAIGKYISKKNTVADIGCGVGHFLPLLSSRAKKVFAIDFSAKCLSVAKQKNSGAHNIEYLLHDMTKPLRISCDIAVSANFLISHQPELIRAMMKNLTGAVKKGGYALLVVPSLESILFSFRKIYDLRIASGETIARSRTYVSREMKKDILSLADGVVNVGDVPTKHFLAEEMETALAENKMTVVEKHKIEYPWTTEIDNPPRNLKAPYPWDWFFVAKKK